MAFLSGIKSSRRREPITITVRDTFEVDVLQPTQAEADEEQAAGRKWKRSKLGFDRQSWARAYAKRIKSWRGLNVDIFLWLEVPADSQGNPYERADVEPRFAEAGGEMPYTTENAAWLVEKALESRFVKIINDELEARREDQEEMAKADESKSA